MQDTQDILFGVTGQSFFLDVPEGRPSSVTSVTVYEAEQDDDGATEAATTGSSSVDSTSTTFDATSGFGQSDPRKCNLTATTGIVIGRTYLATNVTGETEVVVVHEIAAADYITSKYPLRNAYAASDTFVSRRISIAVDATWVADKNNLSEAWCPNPRYRIRWVYIVGGVTYARASYFDLVRYVGGHGVNPADMDRLHAGWIDLLPPDYLEDQGRALLDEAYRQLKLELYRDGKADQAVRNAEGMDELVRHRAYLNAMDDKLLKGGQVSADAYRIAKDRYEGHYKNLIREPKLPFAAGGGGGSAPARRAPLWRR